MKKSKDIIAVFYQKGLTLDTQDAPGRVSYFNESLLEDFKSEPYRTLLFFGFEDKDPGMSDSLAFLSDFCRGFVKDISSDPDIEITRKAKPLDTEELLAILRGAPYALGSEHLSVGWLAELRAELGAALDRELLAWEGSVESFIITYNAKLNVAGRVFFHLVENKSSDCPFAFLATYSSEAVSHNRDERTTGEPKNSELKNNIPPNSELKNSIPQNSKLKNSIPQNSKRKNSELNNVGQKKANHVPLKSALIEYKDKPDQLLRLLSTVSKAADRSGFISELVENGELFSPLKFSADEAYTFLKEIPLYEECGIMCRMPDWWRKKNVTPKLTVSIGEKEPSRLGLDALLDCKPSLLIDGNEISREEIEWLLTQTVGLSLLKGKWIEVDHDKLKAALLAYDRAEAMTGVAFADAMRMELGIRAASAYDLGEDTVVTNGQWLRSVTDRLASVSLSAPTPTSTSAPPAPLASPAPAPALASGAISPGEDFKARLRGYQQAGFNWLAAMKGLGFGALLADDMGLGKTVQILALLEYMRRNGGVKALLVIPASLIGNWEKELARFTPKISYSTLHSKNTALNDVSDLFITTYGMVLRLEQLRTRKWDVLIIDEAQAIKNPAAGQTKAVKALKASFKIAMTGTPVENRLSDLWSLFDFLNAGFLGTAKEFSNYADNIKRRGSYAKLRETVSPFILRRLKTDKSIISDLPDKIEIKEYVALSGKQKLLYQGLIKEISRKLETAEGIERKGVALAAIMKFKQICNHPDQYLAQPSFKETDSGKFQKLREICETIYEKRERALIFTQFREMTAPISEFLAGVFEREGLVLHGETAVKKRAALVEKFNGAEYAPFMVLSLKAGGVGLNLTAANHVIHFDRWWNPAVENQATDRAFRIGQTKNVMAHKFIAAGTVEEKIDAMIEDKQKLAGDIVASSGEKWITEMNNDELMNLFKLEV